MAKKMTYGEDARGKVLTGMEMVARAVMVTMGPKGKNVLLEQSYGAPSSTNDGVSVAKEIELEDKEYNLGAELIKQAAENTNKNAGDGTTTTTVLAYAMAKEGQKYIKSGVNPFALSKGLHKAVKNITDGLAEKSIPVKGKNDIQDVASLSAQDEEVGKLISEVMEEVGEDGVITVEEGKTMGLSKEVVKGMQFDQGYGSPYFMTDSQRMEAVIKNPYILVTDKKISSMKDIVGLLESAAQAGKKDFVLIADDVEGDALANLVLNKIRGTLNVSTVKAPGFGDRKKEMLKDIAAVTGATFITEDLGLKLEEATVDMLGTAEKVVSTKDNTTIVDGKGNQDDIEARLQEIRIQIENTDSDYDKEKLQERLARLAGGVAVIRVGAATEPEMKNKKAKIEDALNATRAAVSEGIVPGGGVTLVHLAKQLDNMKTQGQEEEIGVSIIKEAIQYPVKRIAENAGHKGDRVIEKIKEKDEFTYGFDAKSGEFVDLIKQGIIDPAKVLRVSMENAVSTAVTFLTTDAIISEIPKKDDSCDSCSAGAGGMGGMGGMGGGMPGMM